MTGEGIFAGMPFNDDVRLRLTEIDPDVTISVTRGRHYSLEEDFLYLVRSGSHAVVMPRMAYGKDITEALQEAYGEEAARLVGKTDLAEACGHHS